MFPLQRSILDNELDAMMIPNIATATIRQIAALAERLAKHAQEPIVHLEMGNPGLSPDQTGIEAQCDALRRGVAKNYPNVMGIPELKQNGQRFLKAFFDIDIPAQGIIPTVGSMQASFTLQLLLGQCKAGRDTILFINPGFPAQRHQAKVLGLKQESFDIYDYRGADALRAKLHEMLGTGRIAAMIYSNPNNPAWINLTDEELQVIGEAATDYDVAAIEDLAYLGMDFRSDFGRPYEPPYIPTVAHYTDNCIMLLSASKIFSYAGERVAIVCMTPHVYHRRYRFLEEFYEMPEFGDAFVYGVLYTASSGVCHSAQHAFAAMLGAAADGKLDFVGNCREYGRRAARAKEIFARAGFKLVYECDGTDGTPISDGFFFTMGYPGFTGDELQAELLRYGISTISLLSTGSMQQGVRVTVSALNDDKIFNDLERRLMAFRHDHPITIASCQHAM